MIAQGLALFLLAAVPAHSRELATEQPPATRPAPAPAGENQEHRTLAMGDIDILDDPGAEKAQIGNAKILRADASGGKIFVTGLGLGTSSLLVLDGQGQVLRHIVYSVPSEDLSARVKAVRQQLRDVEGITVEAMDGKVVIDGEVLVRADLDRVLLVQDSQPSGLVLNLVTLSKISRGEIGKKMQREINR